MASVERQPLTERQLAGLKRRVEQDEDDYVQFEQKIGEVKILVWLDEQNILVSADDYISSEQTSKLIEALGEARDFIRYGPGEETGEGADKRWVSTLDEDGNDREVASA